MHLHDTVQYSHRFTKLSACFCLQTTDPCFRWVTMATAMDREIINHCSSNNSHHTLLEWYYSAQLGDRPGVQYCHGTIAIVRIQCILFHLYAITERHCVTNVVG